MASSATEKTYLKLLDEALAEFAGYEADGPLDWHEVPVVDAARAYRALLANGVIVEEEVIHIEIRPREEDE